MQARRLRIGMAACAVPSIDPSRALAGRRHSSSLRSRSRNRSSGWRKTRRCPSSVSRCRADCTRPATRFKSRWVRACNILSSSTRSGVANSAASLGVKAHVCRPPGRQWSRRSRDRPRRLLGFSKAKIAWATHSALKAARSSLLPPPRPKRIVSMPATLLSRRSAAGDLLGGAFPLHAHRTNEHLGRRPAPPQESPAYHEWLHRSDW